MVVANDNKAQRDFWERVAELKQYLEGLLRSVPASELFIETSGMHLYEGLAASPQVPQFLERLRKHVPEKTAVAKYAMEKFLSVELNSWDLQANENRSKGTFFFESGSTIAYLIGALAEGIAGKLTDSATTKSPAHQAWARRFPYTVVTNNFFGLTAFTELVWAVKPTPGSLSTKYYGFLPFYENSPAHLSVEEAKRQKNREVENYSILERVIGRCQKIFATCSNFSLIAGPIVGERANALTKHVIHSSRSPDVAVIEMFDYSKYVPIAEVDTEGLEGPKPQCNCVFAPPEWACNDEILTKTGSDSWHARYARKDFDKFPILERRGNEPYFGEVSHQMSSWYSKARDTDVLVGLPHDDGRATDFRDLLIQECESANAILKEDLQARARWSYKNVSESVEARVAHLQCSES